MSTQERARALMTRHHHAIKNRQQSLLGRAVTEIGMDIDGARYWGHIQGKPNPSFRASYDRSRATLS